MDLAAATALLLHYKYIIIIPLAVIEGPILSMVCGLFVRTGELSLAPAFFALAVGDLIGDALWYLAGRRYGHRFIDRFGRYVSITEESVYIVQRIFDKYHSPILFISKITMGLGFPGATLFTAGLTRVHFGKFMLLNTLGQMFWTGMLVAVGYYLGEVYLAVSDTLGIVSTAALIALIVLVLFGFTRFMRKKFTKSVS